MSIKINTKSTEVPVEIGELKYTLDVSDKGLENLRDNYAKIVDALNTVKPEDEVGIKTILSESFDAILTENSYLEIYKQTPSIPMCIGILQQLLQEVEKQLNSLLPTLTQTEKAQQYLSKKKGATK